MEEIGALVGKYGWWIAAGITVLGNLKAIIATIERLLGKLFPSIELTRQHRRELESLRVEQELSERTDTIKMITEFIVDQRERITRLEKELREEYRNHEDRLVNLIRGYERQCSLNDRTNAQLIEAIRDTSEVLRAQSEHLRHINGTLEELKEKE